MLDGKRGLLAAKEGGEFSLSKTRKVRGCEEEAKNFKTDLNART